MGAYIKFFSEDNAQLIYQSYADCCSESWIESIEGVNSLLNNKINSVTKIESNNITKNWVPNPPTQFLLAFAYELKTDKGCCIIEFRNESNGYYGGDLEFMGNVDLDNRKINNERLVFKKIETDNWPTQQSEQ